MRKEIEINPTGTQFFIPASYYQAVNLSRSKEETRYYLNGVFIHKSESGLVLVATDGHTLLKAELPYGAFIGDDVTTDHRGLNGAILNIDVTEKAFKSKTTGELWIYGDTSTGIAQFVDMCGHDDPAMYRLAVTEFTIIDGTFPDYTRVVPTGEETDRDGKPFEKANFGFDPTFMAMFHKAHVFLSGVKSAAISLTIGDPTGPALVNFSLCPALVGVLMPMRMS